MDIGKIRDKITVDKYTISFSHTEKAKDKKEGNLDGIQVLFLQRQGARKASHNRLSVGCPRLSKEDIEACLHYAVSLVHDAEFVPFDTTKS
jgi:hypothetical protein